MSRRVPQWLGAALDFPQLRGHMWILVKYYCLEVMVDCFSILFVRLSFWSRLPSTCKSFLSGVLCGQ
jgi:hypothetical protein